MSTASRAAFSIPNDWYLATVPSNVTTGSGTYVETSYRFLRYRSHRENGLVVGRGAALYAPTFDVGPLGRITIGDFALLSSAHIVCDDEVTIGPMTMLAWHVVIMDSYRRTRGMYKDDIHVSGLRWRDEPPRPVRIGSNVWLGFECCVLPGVTIGDHSVIGARSVVTGDVPPNCVAAGNPARVVRRFDSPRAEKRTV